MDTGRIDYRNTGMTSAEVIPLIDIVEGHITMQEVTIVPAAFALTGPPAPAIGVRGILSLMPREGAGH